MGDTSGAAFELRRQRRSSMLAIPERLALPFAKGCVEMRARPNGTGGTLFRYHGYASTFQPDEFEMWDMWGEPYTEDVNPAACTRTLANKADVAFLIGHNDAGILMARTKSGTMHLGADSRGLEVDVPSMDGSREDVRALASAVERGDMDEMSMAFVVRQQEWSANFERRTLLEIDLNRGDVSAVVFGANPGTSGSSMTALPTEALTLRRPVSVRQGEQRAQDEIVDMSGAPDYNPVPHAYDPGALQCANPDCTVPGGARNSGDAKFCDQCGGSLYAGNGVEVVDDSGVVEDIEGAAMSDAELLSQRGRELELLEMGA